MYTTSPHIFFALPHSEPRNPITDTTTQRRDLPRDKQPLTSLSQTPNHIRASVSSCQDFSCILSSSSPHFHGSPSMSLSHRNPSTM
ncbi:unnamed protein product [Cyprideis torosa]|uniref:Uncharacterized protein n=1 Tax=Cyprideis torosa TaxID=163714 RepID=A0A7R8W269_9CRUS|nr:unnamed protein product [Cyprideis torosa]CAG0881612.1 unnamed protein product [Cyprideis torosa]